MNKKDKKYCARCKEEIPEILIHYESFKYKTRIGKIKTVYCCLACQMSLTNKEVEK